MFCEMNNRELCSLISKQLNSFFDFVPDSVFERCIGEALNRAETCFQATQNPYFSKDGNIIFSPYHTVQYSIFLYYLSNCLDNAGDVGAEKVYYLNKIMNSVDWYCAIALPTHFCAEHPVGSVLGRAVYGDYLSVYQGVTVGGNRSNGKLYYPVIGEHVALYANSMICGKCKIGNYVMISANSYIKDQDVPDCSIVFGSSPNLIIKQRSLNEIKERTSSIWK